MKNVKWFYIRNDISKFGSIEIPLFIKWSNEIIKNLPIFKKNIKNWKGEDFNWRLCKNYVAQVGFLETQ